MNKVSRNEILKQLATLAMAMHEDVKEGRLPRELSDKYHKIFERDLLDKVSGFGVKEE